MLAVVDVTVDVRIAGDGLINAGRWLLVGAGCEHRQASVRCGTLSVECVAAAEYGAEVIRACDATVGFGIFGVQTAQGSSPTKRSPTGLASGCVWELIFIDFKIYQLILCFNWFHFDPLK